MENNEIIEIYPSEFGALEPTGKRRWWHRLLRGKLGEWWLRYRLWKIFRDAFPSL